MRRAMSKKVGAGGRFDIFLDSALVHLKSENGVPSIFVSVLQVEYNVINSQAVVNQDREKSPAKIWLSSVDIYFDFDFCSNEVIKLSSNYQFVLLRLVFKQILKNKQCPK